LKILETTRKLYPEIMTKSGIMVGLGEREDELYETMDDLAEAGCELLTIGQYLMPKKGKLPVLEYITPERFETFRIKAIEKGFKAVSSSPFTRSSMNAEEMYLKNARV